MSGIPKDTREAVALVRRHLFHGGQVIRYLSLTPSEERPLVNCSPSNKADVATGQEASVAKTLFDYLRKICDEKQWRILFVEREPNVRNFGQWRRWTVKYHTVISVIDDEVWGKLERIREEERKWLEA